MQLLSVCFAGVKNNLRPGLVLQAFALLLLLAYYFVPAARAAFDQLGQIKQQHGYLYSSLSGGLFGGLVPYLFLLGTGRVPAHRRLPELAFYLGFWLWKGAEVDAFYRGQALLFGSDASFTTILNKTLVDQFIYNVLWAAPCQTLFYLWKDADFSLAGTKQRLREVSFAQRTLTVLFSTWLVWIPAVAVVYSLPSPLQIPIFNLVLCFWCLLLSYLSRES